MVAADHIHPVARVAQNIIRKSDEGAFSIDPEGLAVLRYGLEKHGSDPALPAAIISIYELAAALIERGSPETALRLLECVVEARPPILETARQQIAEEKLHSERRRKRAPRMDAPAPDGAIKVATFFDPGMQSGRR